MILAKKKRFSQMIIDKKRFTQKKKRYSQMIMNKKRFSQIKIGACKLTSWRKIGWSVEGGGGGVHVSSIVIEAIKTNSIFSRRDFKWKKKKIK